MIIKEYYLTRNDGVKYSEAIDVETAPYTYVETDEVIQDGKNINK